MNKKCAVITGAMSTVIIFCGLILHAGAVGEPYDSISKRNLFHPERKEWIMEKADAKKPEDTKKTVPKVDTKQIQLLGTVIFGDVRKAIVRSAAARGGADRNADTYMAGDYIEGYLLKEIEEKKVVINNNATNEDIILFLHEGKAQRSTQKTDIAQEPPPPTEEKRIVRRKGETGKEITERIKKTIEILKGRESDLVRKQAERDLEKLQRLIPVMPEEDQGQAAALKKELDDMAKRKK